MKKFVKLTSLFLVILTLTMPLTACDKGTSTYYGIIVYGVSGETTDALLVEIGSLEVLLPIAEADMGDEKVKIKKGDIVKLTFEGTCYIRETAPLTFGLEPTGQVLARNVDYNENSDGGTITFDTSLISGNLTENSVIVFSAKGKKDIEISEFSINGEKISINVENNILQIICAAFSSDGSIKIKAE